MTDLYAAIDVPLQDFPRHLRNCAALGGRIQITIPATNALRLARIIDTHFAPPPPPPPPPALSSAYRLPGWGHLTLWWLSGLLTGASIVVGVIHG